VFSDRETKLEPKLAANFLQSLTAICESLAPEFSTFQRGFARGKFPSPSLLFLSRRPKGLSRERLQSIIGHVAADLSDQSWYCPRWHVCNPEMKNGEAFVSESCHIVVMIRDFMKTITCYVTGATTVVGYHWSFHSANTTGFYVYQSLLFTNECTSDFLKNGIKIYIEIAPTYFGAVTLLQGAHPCLLMLK
jgi:hypothetical protein